MIPRTYNELPRIPDAGLLTRYLDTLGVIVPLARTNIILNGSLEYNDTGWTFKNTVTGVARSAAQSYHGAYSWAVTPSTAATNAAMNGGGGGNGINPTASAIYAVSCKVLGAAGVGYRLVVENNIGPVEVASIGFTGTGRWQWVSLVYQEVSVPTGVRQFWVLKNNNRDGTVFYIDGMQVELIADGYYVPTTYIDGDQKGLVPNQFPAPYGWNGTPGGSTSYRIGQTRAGGRIVLLKNLGFLLSAIIGLGMAPPAHQALTFAQLDGGQYENTLKPPRQFSLAGRIAAATPNSADSGLAQLGQLLDRDLTYQRQPLVLTMQAQECGVDSGERVFVPALYSGGLEGEVLELPTKQVPISFTQYIPYVNVRDQGAALAVQQSVSNANGILQRPLTGVWQALGSGLAASGIAQAWARGNDGSLFVGGNTTGFGGVANTRAIARWDGSVWNAMGSGGAVGAIVSQTGLAVAPNGDLYAGGTWTLMGGVANTVNIAKWDGAVWTALGTGTNGLVRTVVVGPDGSVYIGGDFTLAGGVANTVRVAKWNGSAWVALSTGANNSVYQLIFGKDGYLYAVGTFTTIGGVAANNIARWNGTAWSALNSATTGGLAAIAVGPDGLIYVGGAFTTIGGVSANNIAYWNGVNWFPLGSGSSISVVSLSFGTDGMLYAGGQFATPNGVAFADRVAKWNGSIWLPLDVTLPSAPTTIYAVGLSDGTINVGFGTSGSATAAGITATTNSGSIEAPPTLIIRGPSSGTSKIYQLLDVTTGAAIYFNLTLVAGETAILTLDPTNTTFVSSFQGNILNTILPGSNLSTFTMQPGANSMSMFVASSTVTAVLQWPIGYNRLSDALYQATAP